MVFSLLLTLFLTAVALIFAFQNAQPVSISFLVWRFDSSLVLVIFFAVGLLAGILLVLPGRIRTALATASRKREWAAFDSKLAECMARLEQSEAGLKERAGAASSDQARPAPGRRRRWLPRLVASYNSLKLAWRGGLSWMLVLPTRVPSSLGSLPASTGQLISRPLCA